MIPVEAFGVKLLTLNRSRLLLYSVEMRELDCLAAHRWEAFSITSFSRKMDGGGSFL